MNTTWKPAPRKAMFTPTVVVLMCVASVVSGLVIGNGLRGSSQGDSLTEMVTGPKRVTVENPLHEPYIRFIRRYLEQNLPDGEWEEITWYGTKTSRPPEFVTDARLKFRARNALGGEEVYDWVWRFNQNGFKMIYPTAEWRNPYGSVDRDPIEIDENALP